MFSPLRHVGMQCRAVHYYVEYKMMERIMWHLGSYSLAQSTIRIPWRKLFLSCRSSSNRRTVSSMPSAHYSFHTHARNSSIYIRCPLLFFLLLSFLFWSGSVCSWFVWRAKKAKRQIYCTLQVVTWCDALLHLLRRCWYLIAHVVRLSLSLSLSTCLEQRGKIISLFTSFSQFQFGKSAPLYVYDGRGSGSGSNLMDFSLSLSLSRTYFTIHYPETLDL